MDRKRIAAFIVVFLLILGLVIYIYINSNKKDNKDFKIDTILLKSRINQGGLVSNNLKITNLGPEQDFKIKVEHVKNLTSLSEESFKLKTNEVKDVKVTFKDEHNTPPGVYVGRLVTENKKDKIEVPIIIDIRTKDVLFTTNLDVGPEYKEIKSGEKYVAGIRIFNLKDLKTHIVEATYLVKDVYGDTISSETENIVVGTDVLITKTVNLPKNIPLGDYVFAVVTKFEDSVGTSSYLFTISEKRSNGFFGFDINYFGILVFVFLFGILVLVFYMVHDRDRLFLELKKQHLAELEFLYEKIKKQKEVSLAKAKTAPEKKIIAKRFEKAKKVLAKNIKEKHKKQRVEFTRLKRHNKEDEMKQKLEEWKSQGFNVEELEKLRKLNKENIKGKIKEWEKEGFDVSAIKK